MSRSLESDANNYNMVRGMNNDDSDSSSNDTIPSFTHLGRRTVPITSTCHDLLNAMEKFSWDIPFTVELIKRSSICFTESQLILIQKVLDTAEIERKFGYGQHVRDFLTEFEASLDARIEEEKVFFTAQKKRYTEIYEALVQSSFPYSSKQAACLHRMLKALYSATGDPNSEVDKEIVASLRDLVELLQIEDHLRDPTPHRVIVHNTIPYYLKNMIHKLELLAKEEGKRPNPSFIHPDVTIDLAIFLVVNLDSLVVLDKMLTPREHFHFGLVEIYTKLVGIFKESDLEFTNHQEVAIKKIERRIRDLKRSPVMSKHENVNEAIYEFMSELEEASPDREVILDENDKIVLALNGSVNKTVRDISWWLVNLQPAASAHLVNFATFGHGVDNVIAKITERFLSLYPMH